MSIEAQAEEERAFGEIWDDIERQSNAWYAGDAPHPEPEYDGDAELKLMRLAARLAFRAGIAYGLELRGELMCERCKANPALVCGRCDG